MVHICRVTSELDVCEAKLAVLTVKQRHDIMTHRVTGG